MIATSIVSLGRAGFACALVAPGAGSEAPQPAANNEQIQVRSLRSVALAAPVVRCSGSMDIVGIVIVVLFALVFVSILGVVGFTLARMIAKGGPREVVFGGRVLSTFGEVEGRKRTLMKMLGRVHLVQTDDGPAVVLEMVGTAPVSYRMMALALGAQEARALVAHLQNAIQTLESQRHG